MCLIKGAFFGENYFDVTVLKFYQNPIY